MNIYEKIDAIFAGEADDRPKWAIELLEEIKELKIMMREYKPHPTVVPTRSVNNTPKLAYYQFVKQLRERYQDETATLYYKNLSLGVRSGLLYDKNTNRLITTVLANEIYLALYNQSKQAG